MLKKVYLKVTYRLLAEHHLTPIEVENRLMYLMGNNIILYNEELDMHYCVRSVAKERDSVGVKYIINISIIDIYRGLSKTAQEVMCHAFSRMTELLPTKPPENRGAKERCTL